MLIKSDFYSALFRSRLPYLPANPDYSPRNFAVSKAKSIDESQLHSLSVSNSQNL